MRKGWLGDRDGAVMGGAPCEELAVTHIVVDPATRWGRGWRVVVLSDKGSPRWRCSVSLSPGRPTAQGPQGALRSLQPSTLQVPEGGGEGNGTDLTRGTNTLAQHPVEKHLLWGRRRAQGSSGVGGRRAEPLPLSSAARGPGSVGG